MPVLKLKSEAGSKLKFERPKLSFPFPEIINSTVVNSISEFDLPVSGYYSLSTKNSGRHFSKPTLTNENIFGLPFGKPI